MSPKVDLEKNVEQGAIMIIKETPSSSQSGRKFVTSPIISSMSQGQQDIAQTSNLVQGEKENIIFDRYK